MADFSFAINLIQKYEGFSEKAYGDPNSGNKAYTLGYGTQYYPDGTPVKQGQCCSKEKALEYLFHEINVINEQLSKLNLDLDSHMKQALISFIHSVGWEPFLYSSIIDCIENDNLSGACEEISRWIFDENYKIIGGLLDRRKEEIKLFLTNIDIPNIKSSDILLSMFQDFTGKIQEIEAIQFLEENINPYILSDFANRFKIDNDIDEVYCEFTSNIYL